MPVHTASRAVSRDVLRLLASRSTHYRVDAKLPHPPEMTKPSQTPMPLRFIASIYRCDPWSDCANGLDEVEVRRLLSLLTRLAQSGQWSWLRKCRECSGRCLQLSLRHRVDSEEGCQSRGRRGDEGGEGEVRHYWLGCCNLMSICGSLKIRKNVFMMLVARRAYVYRDSSLNEGLG